MQFVTGSQFGFDTLREISCFNNPVPDQYYRRMWCAMQFDSSIMAGDASMDTASCLSPTDIINTDSRKRHSEIEPDNNNCIKKSYYNNNNLDTDTSVYYFKLLIPCMAAGAIIGKGGETIAQLQREKKAKIKMSKANDFYPGTTERVCIISSNSPESIMSVLIFVMEKIREKPELAKPIISEMNNDREKQVKILVPNTTAGMIIGKGGSYIKQIKEQTGAYIQLSQKAKDVSLPERCITVSGDIETNRKVCELILQKIMEDPQSGSCLNLSYADITGPVANFSPTGSPFAHGKSVTNGGCVTGSVNGSLNLCLNMPNATVNNADIPIVSKIIEQLSMTLHASGYSETAVTEIITAITILTRYGMVGIGNGYLSNENMMQTPSPAATTSLNGGLSATDGVDLAALNAAASGLFNAALNGHNSLDLGTTAASSGLDIFHPSQLSLAAGNNCLGLLSTGNDLLTDVTAVAAAAAAIADIKKLDLEVTDGVLAAILGPVGCSLLEIQYRSGAIIQISRKSGLNSGCSNNKLLSISGTTAAIGAARFLIEQKIAESISKVAQNLASAID